MNLLKKLFGAKKIEAVEVDSDNSIITVEERKELEAIAAKNAAALKSKPDEVVGQLVDLLMYEMAKNELLEQRITEIYLRLGRAAITTGYDASEAIDRINKLIDGQPAERIPFDAEMHETIKQAYVENCL